MSWTATYTSVEDFNNDTPESRTPQAEADWSKEAVEQLIVVREAARLLLSYGKTTQDVLVYLSGHANPDHKPPPGWGKDYVSVSIYWGEPASVEVEEK